MKNVSLILLGAVLYKFRKPLGSTAVYGLVEGVAFVSEVVMGEEYTDSKVDQLLNRLSDKVNEE